MCLCRNAGFTLIEILIAVVIVAVIAGVSVPAIRMATIKTQDASVARRQQVITDALTRARLDSEDNPILYGDAYLTDYAALVQAVDYLIEHGYITVRNGQAYATTNLYK